RFNPLFSWSDAADSLPENERQFFLKYAHDWNDMVSENERFWPFHHSNSRFRNVNYLFDDLLFRRLQNMAREGRIWAQPIDLNESQEFEQVIFWMNDQSIPLSILDISNSWWRRYISAD